MVRNVDENDKKIIKIEFKDGHTDIYEPANGGFGKTIEELISDYCKEHAIDGNTIENYYRIDENREPSDKGTPRNREVC